MLYYHCFVNEKGYFFARKVTGEDVRKENENVKLIVLEEDIAEEQISFVLRSKFLEEPFQHVSYKKEPNLVKADCSSLATPGTVKADKSVCSSLATPGTVKEEEDDWETKSWHCGCPCDPYPDDPFGGYGVPDQDPESEKLRKDPNKSLKKKCGKSKRKARKSEGQKNLETLKIEMNTIVKEVQQTK
jgi:hypothetical protein